MFKTAVIHVRPTAESDAALAAAVEFVRRREGMLIGVGARGPYETMVAGMEPLVLEPLMEAEAADLEEARKRFVAASHALGEHAQWVVRHAYPNDAIKAEACGVDLVIAETTPGQGSGYATQASGLVMEAGLPVLFVPPNLRQIGERSVMVAWRDTAEAREAVSAALPLLKAAESVALIQVGGDAAGPEAWRSLHAVQRRLAAHGVTASADIRLKVRSVAETLREAARSHSTDLIVMGAYGHSRAREWILGGVTRDLLACSDVPLLLTH